MLVCLQAKEKGMAEHVVTLTLHQPLPDSGEKWELVSINRVV